MLMECDSGAQRPFFRAFECDRFGSKQCGPPLMESDCYALVGRILETKLAVDIKKGMTERVSEASTGRQQARHHGHSLQQGSPSKRGGRRCSWCGGGPAR